MDDSHSRRWPGFSDEAHPDVFNTLPKQPATLKPGQIAADKAAKFFNEVFCQGYQDN